MNHWIVRSLAVAAFCSPILLRAVQFSGSVRAADQLVPGATVTAINGGAKVTAFTDERGRFTMDLIPGVWDIQVEMFEFTPVKGQVSVGVERISKDYVLTMPKVAQRDGAAAAVTTTTVAPTPQIPGQAGRRGNRGGGDGTGGGGFGGRRADGSMRGGGRGQGDPAGRGAHADAAGGRGGPNGRGAPGQAQPGFQSAQVRATPEGERAAANQQADQQVADTALEGDDVFSVIGSTSGGLEQSMDDETRRQRAMGG